MCVCPVDCANLGVPAGFLSQVQALCDFGLRLIERLHREPRARLGLAPAGGPRGPPPVVSPDLADAPADRYGPRMARRFHAVGTAGWVGLRSLPFLCPSRPGLNPPVSCMQTKRAAVSGCAALRCCRVVSAVSPQLTLPPPPPSLPFPHLRAPACGSLNYAEAMLTEGPFDPREASARREVLIAGLWTLRGVVLDSDAVKEEVRAQGLLDTLMLVRARWSDGAVLFRGLGWVARVGWGGW
jgi:hypothetical protein